MIHSLLVAAVLIRTATAQSTCFFPNGEIATGNYPCDPSASVSVCCGAGAVCLNNKVCLANNQETIRGACTDSTWRSPDCPQWCTGADTGGTDLISCQNVTNSPADYCCDHTNGCCDSGVGRFQILPSQALTSAIWISSATAFSDLVLSTSTSSSSLPATTTSASPTETTVSPPSSTATSTNSPSSSGLSTGASVGIGVGVGVGALLILGAIGAFFWRKRSKKSELQSGEAKYEQEQKTNMGSGSDSHVYQRQELAGEREIAQASDIYARPAELDPQHVHELMGEHGELAGDQPKR